MADTVKSLVERVLEDGGFDAPESKALGWLTERQRLMCSRSGCYRRTASIGPTVAGQRDYALPSDVVQLLEVLIEGLPYEPGRSSDLAAGTRGWLMLLGEGGLAVRDDTESGQTMLAIYPTPQVGVAPEPGASVEVRAVCRPPDLVIGEDSTLKVPGEYTAGLVSGAIATGLTRLEKRADLATPFLTEFEAACAELERQTNAEFLQTGPAEIRIAGFNA